MVKISIIIPVYNTEMYLDECLKSAIGQTIQEIEIICVDDGSTDNSEKILKKYAEWDKRIIVLRNSKNLGPSYTRNRGLEYASGEYICFLDSDDMLKPEALEELYEIAEKNKLDCVYFGAEEIFEKESLKINIGEGFWKYKKTTQDVLCGEDLFVKLIHNKEARYAIGTQFLKHSSLLRNNIKFYEGIIHEDVLFTFRALFKAERAICIEKCYYYYRHRENSITTKHKSVENLRGYFICYYEILHFWLHTPLKSAVNMAIDEQLTKIYLMIKQQYNRLEEKASIKEICGDDIKMQHLFKVLFANEQIPRYYTSLEGKINQIKGYEVVVVYGAGVVAKETLEVLRENGVEVHSVAVSAFDDNPLQIKGIPVRLIDDLADLSNKAIVLIAVTPKYQQDIENKLQLLNFKNILSVTN